MIRSRTAVVVLTGIAIGGVLLAAATRSEGGVGSVGTSTTTTVTPMRWSNPVIASDFPDPHVVLDGDRYVAVATNGPGGTVQVATSRDLATWSQPTEALSSMPSWASPRTDLVWAPSIVELGGRWILYGTFQDASSKRQCIGLASSRRSTGPYSPVGDSPLVCPVADGGAIDPEVLVDGGTPWLLWKVDGNCCGRASVIRSQQLSADGTSLVDSSSELIRLDQDWERGPGSKVSTVEGPSMARFDDRLVLLYSGGGYAGAGYAMSSAACESVAGPCMKPNSVPIVSSGSGLAGPGGGSFFRDLYGRTWVAYHAWDPAAVGYGSGGVRSMRIDPVVVVGDRLVALGPSTGPMEFTPDDLVPAAAVPTTTVISTTGGRR